MFPSLIQIRSKTAEKNAAQTNRQTNRHYENNGHLAVNQKYDINPELFFQLDKGDRRGHDQKLLKKRSILNVRKYAFSNRVIDDWNLLPAICINCSTINTSLTSKKHLPSELESEAVSLSVVTVGIIRRKPVLTHASIVCGGMLASANSVTW